MARVRVRMLAIGIALLGPLGGAAATAQTLELTRPIARPALPNPSLVTAMVKALEQEASDLSAASANATEHAEQIALLARANVRRLAAELLALGDRLAAGQVEGDGGNATRAASDGNVIVLNGLKLSNACAALDDAITRAIAPTDELAIAVGDRSAVLTALNAFNHACADHVQRGAPADPEKSSAAIADEWTSAILSHLLPVVAEPDAEPEPSHWVGDARVINNAGGAAASQPEHEEAALFKRLSARIDSSSVDEQARSSLRSIVDFLERGVQFPELQPRVRLYTQTMADVLDCADAISNAQWLGDDARAPLTAGVAQAVEWFRTPETRPQGLSAAGRLSAMTRALNAATRLAEEGIDRKQLRSSFIAAQAAAEKSTTSTDAAGQFTRLASVLERMVAYRELPPSGLARELRQAERDLAKTYRESEQSVLKELADGALVERSLGDPAMQSLLDDHRQRLEDLQRLRRMPQWSAAIAQMYPPASKDFQAQTKRWAAALIEPSRRPEAILTITRFEKELALFERLPFEATLNESRPEAIELTAGQHKQILALIIEKRRAWADDWSRLQQTPEPAQTMALLHRLAQMMQDAAALTRLNPAMLNRWPAWEISAEVVDRGRRDVITRLKLACAALVQGDEGVAAQQLERVQNEAPLARLAGRLAHRLGNDLAERRDGVMGVLAQLVHEPPAHAVMLNQRSDLAEVCRYAAEAEHARASGNAEAAEEINAYLRERVERLLRAIE